MDRESSQAIEALDYAQTKTPSFAAGEEPAESLTVFLERNLAVVLSQEVEESFVVASLHVEEPRDDLIVAARLL
jgi:hypothetical protein